MSKPGKRCKFRDLEFWAENGFVRLEDQQTGDYFTITRDEAFARAKAIAEEINSIKWPNEQYETVTMVQEMCDVIKEAEEQGDPTDPAVMEYMGKEVKRSRRAKILLPGGTIAGTEIKPLTDFMPKKIVLGR